LLHTGFKVGEKVEQYDERWSHFLNELIIALKKIKKVEGVFTISRSGKQR
jgi:hypothetical protein